MSESLRHVQAGDPLLATDARGVEHPCVADSGLEGTHAKRSDGSYGKIHDFPVVWVKLAGHSDRVPWPVESLRRPESSR